MAAEKCPVCQGSGKLSDSDGSTTSVPQPKTCHGCYGKGWVETGGGGGTTYPTWPYYVPYPWSPYVPSYSYPMVTCRGSNLPVHFEGLGER